MKFSNKISFLFSVLFVSLVCVLITLLFWYNTKPDSTDYTSNILVINTLYTLLFCVPLIFLIYFLSRQQSIRIIQSIKNLNNQIQLINNSSDKKRIQLKTSDAELNEIVLNFNKMLERLENASELQQQFIRSASHELRSPLTAILGELDIALNKQRTIVEYENILKRIAFEAGKLNEITNNLLIITQAAKIDEKIHFESIRLDELIEDTRDQALIFHPDASITIKYINLPKNQKELEINGVYALLKQAIMNIISNAVKYGDKRVWIEVNYTAKHFVIEIIDEGRGIPENELPEIFLPFFRASNANDTKGHGMGLPLVKKIIELHNGKLALVKNNPKGIRAVITL